MMVFSREVFVVWVRVSGKGETKIVSAVIDFVNVQLYQSQTLCRLVLTWLLAARIVVNRNVGSYESPLAIPPPSLILVQLFMN